MHYIIIPFQIDNSVLNGFSPGTRLFHRIVGWDNLSGVIIQEPLVINTVIGDILEEEDETDLGVNVSCGESNGEVSRLSENIEDMFEHGE